MKKSDPLRELHEIREKMAKELKGLSVKEKNAAINNEALKFLKETGLERLTKRYKKAV